jgi:hypothetical protein
MGWLLPTSILLKNSCTWLFETEKPIAFFYALEYRRNLLQLGKSPERFGKQNLKQTGLASVRVPLRFNQGYK